MHFRHHWSILWIIGIWLCGGFVGFVQSYAFGMMMVSPIEQIGNDFVATVDALRNAAVPISLGSTFAITVAEATAGAIGGLASRRTADAIGDKKIDNVATKLQSTSAYFVARSIFFRVNVLLGLPRPLARIAATVLASIVSEGTKARGRRENAAAAGEKLEGPEIINDIAKWLSYDALDTMGPNSLDSLEKVGFSFIYGAVSAFIGCSARDVFLSTRYRPKPDGSQTANVRDSLKVASYSQSILEGAVLFGCYKIIVEVLEVTLPSSLTTKFLFDQMLETFEEDVKEATQVVEEKLQR